METIGQVRISVVSYLNSAPLVRGILNSKELSGCKVTLDIPAVGAARLRSGEADIALVPVGAFPDRDSVHWIGRYCIGVEGPVRSVGLFSEVPLDRIRRIWLDSHSRTSAELIRLLARDYWKINCEFLQAPEGFEDHLIRGVDAGLCIGDKVFAIEGKYPVFRDLAEEWIQFTGKPFVFAAWAAKAPVDPDLVRMLDEAQEAGIKEIPGVARDWSVKMNLSEQEIREYLTRNISYGFTPAKRDGLERFLTFIRSRS